MNKYSKHARERFKQRFPDKSLEVEYNASLNHKPTKKQMSHIKAHLKRGKSLYPITPSTTREGIVFLTSPMTGTVLTVLDMRSDAERQGGRVSTDELVEKYFPESRK